MGMKHFEGEDEEFQLEKMEEETEQMMKLRYLNRENALFERTPGGFVSLTIEDEHYDRVRIYRAFPFTDPEHFISIRMADEKSKEIGIIQDLRKDVSEETAQMLMEQMNMRYFTPVITKINSIKDEYGHAYFDVETNQGACKFVIHMNSGAVVNLTDVRLLITDLDGNRFEIPDYTKLSAGEIKKLDLFL